MSDRVQTTSRRRSSIPTISYVFLIVLLGLVPLFALRDKTEAQYIRSVTWDRYDVTLTLNENGTYHVVERQVVDFEGGPFSQGFADIPMGRIDAIEDVKVSEVTGGRTVPYDETDCCESYLSPGEFLWSR